jgi:hypothetical protein
MEFGMKKRVPGHSENVGPDKILQILLQVSVLIKKIRTAK